MLFKQVKIRLWFIALLVYGIVQVKECTQYKYKPIAITGNDSIPAGVVSFDLNKILKRGKLIAITDNSSTSYFIYKGQPMGFEYELLDSFARHLGVQLDVIVAKNMNTIFDDLNKGKADIAAANLTITQPRLKIVNFTYPLLYTRQVLIQRLPEGWRKMTRDQINRKLIRNPINLVGKKVYVRKESSFYERLRDLSNEVGGGIKVVEAPGSEVTEELINDVSKGVIDYTVADENVAMINQTYYDNLDIKTAISFPQKIAWAVRKTSPILLSALDKWLKHEKKGVQFATIYNKYFVDQKAASERNNSEFYSIHGGKISPYDNIIKRDSKILGWDWRLLASQIYQESHFNPKARSWAGAYGLMQLIPATCKRYNLDTSCISPAQSIKAGVLYLKSIDDYWKKYIKNKNERIKFDLASYNVGLGHIIDARNLTIKYGLDPDQWKNNVGYFLLEKSKPKYYNDAVVKYGYCRGQEPFNYVKEIMNRYELYKNAMGNSDYSVAEMEK